MAPPFNFVVLRVGSIFSLAVLPFLVVALDYDAEDFYRNLEAIAPDKMVLEALEAYFPNPMKLNMLDQTPQNPCCPHHTSRFVCDPTCLLDQDEVDEVTEVTNQIITASGCSCKKVKYCTMQENGFRVFIVVVPSDFVRNVSHFIESSPPPALPNETLSIQETIGKHAPENPNEMLLEWLAQTLRMFVWKNGRCDDDFVITVVHDHHHGPGSSSALVGGEMMLANMNRISWSAGSAILNQTSISPICIDEVFHPLREYLHSVGREHRRLSVRANDSLSTQKFAGAITDSLSRLFKAFNRRDDLENPCFNHEGEEEEKTQSSQQVKLIAFAGITSLLLPFVGCLIFAMIRCLSRRYCTEDPNKYEGVPAELAATLPKHHLFDEEGLVCVKDRHHLYCQINGANHHSHDPPSSPQLQGSPSTTLPSSATYTVIEPRTNASVIANQEQIIYGGVETPQSLSPIPALQPNCRPSRYYCGDHKHRLIYRYYKPSVETLFNPSASPPSPYKK